MIQLPSDFVLVPAGSATGRTLPNAPGAYVLIDAAGKAAYAGSSHHLRNRLLNHSRRKYVRGGFFAYKRAFKRDLQSEEQRLIDTYKPYLNKATTAARLRPKPCADPAWQRLTIRITPEFYPAINIVMKQMWSAGVPADKITVSSALRYAASNVAKLNH